VYREVDIKIIVLDMFCKEAAELLELTKEKI